MKLLLKMTVFLLSLLSVSITIATSNDAFTASQKKQIEDIVHSYLVQNPSVLMEVSKTLYDQKIQAQTKKIEATVRAYASKILRSPYALIAGNPKGPVTLVEFFDYQCYHCQHMQPSIEHLIKTNPQLRVVLHHVPIEGANSLLAAQMVLAAQLQNKALPFHEALIATQPPLEAQKILEVARRVGLDDQRLQSDIKKKWVVNALKQDYQLVKQMDLDFTPAFVIARTDMSNHSRQPFFLFKGAVPEKELQSKIDQLK